MTTLATFCIVWLLLSLFAAPIIAALMMQAKYGKEIPGVGYVEEQ